MISWANGTQRNSSFPRSQLQVVTQLAFLIILSFPLFVVFSRASSTERNSLLRPAPDHETAFFYFSSYNEVFFPLFLYFTESPARRMSPIFFLQFITVSITSSAADKNNIRVWWCSTLPLRLSLTGRAA